MCFNAWHSEAIAELRRRSELAAVLPEAAAAALAARAAGAAPALRPHQPASAAAARTSDSDTAQLGAPAGSAAPPWLHPAGPGATGLWPGQDRGSGVAQAPAGANAKPPPWLALRANPRIAAVASAQRPAEAPGTARGSGETGCQPVDGADCDADADPDSGPADCAAGDSEGCGSEGSDRPDRELPGLSFGDEAGGAAAPAPGGDPGEGPGRPLARNPAAGGVPALSTVTAAEACGGGGAAPAPTDEERKARRRRCALRLSGCRIAAALDCGAASSAANITVIHSRGCKCDCQYCEPCSASS